MKKMITLIVFCAANLYGAASSQEDFSSLSLIGLNLKLFDAAKADSVTIAEKAIAAGANVNYLSSTYGSTPLVFAAGRGSLHVLNYLIDKGAAINSTSRRGETALYRAVGDDMPCHIRGEIMDSLIAASININRRHAWFADTPLMRLAQNRFIGKTDIFPLAMRLIAAGANIKATNHAGYMAEDWAQKSHPALARFLRIYPGRTAAEVAIFDLAKGYFDPKSATVRGLVREHVEQVINTRKYSPDMINTLSLLVGFMKPSLTLTTVDLSNYFV